MKALKKIAALLCVLAIAGGAICSIYLAIRYCGTVPIIASILLSVAAIPSVIWLVRYMIYG